MDVSRLLESASLVSGSGTDGPQLSLFSYSVSSGKGPEMRVTVIVFGVAWMDYSDDEGFQTSEAVSGAVFLAHC
jgi:hypothetical protein